MRCTAGLQDASAPAPNRLLLIPPGEEPVAFPAAMGQDGSALPSGTGCGQHRRAWQMGKPSRRRLNKSFAVWAIKMLIAATAKQKGRGMSEGYPDLEIFLKH